MKTVAVTFGTGKCRKLAELVTARWNQINDCPCINLTDVIPWDQCPKRVGFGKAYIWDCVRPDVERIIWLDADTYPVIRAPLEELPDVPFAAVRDFPGTLKNIQRKCPEMRSLSISFNSGVFVCRRDTIPVFDELKKTRDPHGMRFEQGALNLLVMEILGGWARLPIEWNWTSAHARHTYGEKTKVKRVPYVYHTAGQPRASLYIMYGAHHFPGYGT